jgi:hypothetical protein
MGGANERDLFLILLSASSPLTCLPLPGESDQTAPNRLDPVDAHVRRGKGGEPIRTNLVDAGVRQANQTEPERSCVDGRCAGDPQEAPRGTQEAPKVAHGF